MKKNHVLLLKKFKNTEGAQLCWTGQVLATIKTKQKPIKTIWRFKMEG